MPSLRLGPFGLALTLVLAPAVLAQDDPLPVPDRARAEALYRTAIRPQSVAEGQAGTVPTGRVVLYGQKIAPPYLLAIRGDSLLLNGVRVTPPIRPPWLPETPVPVTDADRAASTLAARIRAKHAELSALRPASIVRTSLVAHVTTNERTVRNVEWTTPNKLHVVLRNGGEFSMRFNARPSPEPRQVRAALLAKTKEHHERALRSGAMLVIGFGAVLTVPRTLVDATTRRIDAAIDERSLDRLKKAVHSEELARELLFIQR